MIGNNRNSDDIACKIARLRDRMQPTLVDLFSGCGGLSLGFQRAGFKLLGGVEIAPKAARTYARNLFQHHSKQEMELHAKPRDIRKLSPRQFMEDVLGAESPHGLADVIAGGPPCQAFARVGRAKLREIMEHPEAFLRDERANLHLRFLEYVEFFRPLAVLIENVPDIMNFGGQNVAQEIACSLEDMGYEPRYTILNSAHYGVPQMRQRFYLIALLDALETIPSFPDPTHYIDLPDGYYSARMVALGADRGVWFEDPYANYERPPHVSPDLPKAVSAREALEDLPPITSHLEGSMKKGPRRFDTLACYRDGVPPSEYAERMREWPGFEAAEGVYDHVTRYLPRDFEIFRRMDAGDQYPEAYALAQIMFKEKLARLEEATGREIVEGSDEYEELKAQVVPPYDPSKFPNKWRKMEPNEPARTLTAHIGKDTYTHIHYDSEQARVISVREAARLQSFPDGFAFSGAMNAAFRQIGNAVPPLQAYSLARRTRHLLEVAIDEVGTTNERSSTQ